MSPSGWRFVFIVLLLHVLKFKRTCYLKSEQINLRHQDSRSSKGKSQFLVFAQVHV
jgi:hypothetical protein